MSVLRNQSKRARRRAWPIHGYVGPNGGGKSAAMAWDSIPTLLAGRPVLSTVRLLDFQNPRACGGCDEPGHMQPIYGPGELDGDDEQVIGFKIHAAAHPLWIPFRHWTQLLDAERCDVLMDEVTGVASSRESQSMPAPVANKLVQLRRADVVVRWSAPSWARADKIIRECSQAVTYAQGYVPKAMTDEAGDRLWRNRRLFKWRTYDAADFEDFTAGKREQLRAMSVDWHWGPGSPAFSTYDTFDAVLTIGTVTDTGRCYRCGGRRRVPQCSCPDHAAPVPHETDTGGPRVAGSVAASSASGRRVRLDIEN